MCPLYHSVCERERGTGNSRTGCRCAAKPPGCVGDAGQEQQLTHTQLTKDGIHALSLHRSTVPPQTHTFSRAASGSAATVFPPLLPWVCVSVAAAREPFVEPHVVLTFRLLISCDRCIPPGGVEFERFFY